VYHSKEHQYAVQVRKLEFDERDRAVVTLQVIDESDHPGFWKFRKEGLKSENIWLSTATGEHESFGGPEKYKSAKLIRANTPDIVEKPPSNNTTTEADITLIFEPVEEITSAWNYKLRFLDFGFFSLQPANLPERIIPSLSKASTQTLFFFIMVFLVSFLLFIILAGLGRAADGIINAGSKNIDQGVRLFFENLKRK